MRRIIGLLALFASLVSSKPHGVGLATVAKLAGKLYFGSATDNPELSDKAYVEILTDTREFTQFTPTNGMKWDATEPEQGKFNFSAGDQIIHLAETGNRLFRGHNLGKLELTLFSEIIGPDYIEIALRAARAADPHAKLYINDFNIEGEGAKATGAKAFVKSLKARGVPIDGMGFETRFNYAKSHFIVNELPPNISKNMREFNELGVEVAVTELDIRMTLPSTPALLQQQKKDYETVVAACKEVKDCVGITLWDYTDKARRISGTFAGMGAACPWDENLNIKPAYEGIVNGLMPSLGKLL
ncbi:hypothetical protein Clacol_007338 [Clathrus columnatus]|uniref:endo-1,4-beta-xylanase n=1 Tax=Clathrus columnatus TaxID=1419009 RepID=A0AAV5AIY6_9AGAM|nr:hypothetical protein Clacol_007338 [Clathrus columnatus]